MSSSPVAERGRSAPARRRGVVARACAAAAVALAALALGACRGGPPPKLYVLGPAASETDGSTVPTSPATTTAARSGVLGTSAVTLPGYAREPRIANRDEGQRIHFDSENRWAEDPEEAITRLLAERLRHHAGNTVLVEPWPRNFAPVARVEVAFDRLLREPAGGVDAAGRITLLSGDGRDVLDVRPFRARRPASSTEFSAWFAAVAGLIDELARTAVETLADAGDGETPS